MYMANTIGSVGSTGDNTDTGLVGPPDSPCVAMSFYLPRKIPTVRLRNRVLDQKNK